MGTGGVRSESRSSALDRDLPRLFGSHPRRHGGQIDRRYQRAPAFDADTDPEYARTLGMAPSAPGMVMITER